MPTGAHAGQLTLKPCTYATEHGSYAADCGTLVVPENRHDAGSRLIALPVTRIQARSAHPGEPVFRLEGGPGLTNMEFPRREPLRRPTATSCWSAIAASTAPCGSTAPRSSRRCEHASDFLGGASFAAAADAYRSCASAAQADGIDLAGYSLPERVDDLEAARRALGYGRSTCSARAPARARR